MRIPESPISKHEKTSCTRQRTPWICVHRLMYALIICLIENAEIDVFIVNNVTQSECATCNKGLSLIELVISENAEDYALLF